MRYSIGSVARVLGLTPGALHYYEREGLLSVKRTATGHRYYDEGDVWRLLSYEKYHSMEYPVKAVVDQFEGGGSRAQIEARVRACMEEARRKSEYYRQLALSIEAHVNGYERIDELLDAFAFERCQPIWFWNADAGWMSAHKAQQAVASRWVSAMPAAQLAVRMQMDETQVEPGAPRGKAVFGYCILPERAKAVGFDLPPDATRIRSVSCLHTIVACPAGFVHQPEIAFEKSLKYVRSHGLTLSGDPFARVLMGETGPNDLFRAYVDVWTPIQ